MIAQRQVQTPRVTAACALLPLVTDPSQLKRGIVECIDELTGESELIASDDLESEVSDADADPAALAEKQESEPATRRRSAKPERRRG